MVEYRRLSKNEASFYLFKLKLSVLQELLLFLKRIKKKTLPLQVRKI